MKHRGLLFLTFVLLVGMTTMWGCPKKAEVTTSPAAEVEKVTAPSTPALASAETKTSESKAEAPNERSAVSAEGLRPVYFDFNRSLMRDDAKAVLKANGAWLKANPQARIRIEGHCDARGTVEYNQALGQRRAVSAKQYLTFMGISADRITLVSYGKEKPMCTESTEECWQKNRRDDFIVVGK